MRVRCISIHREYVDEIARGLKTDEFRSWKIDPGPLCIATTAKGGAAEIRLLVDVVACVYHDIHERNGVLGHDGYAWKLENVRSLKRTPIVRQIGDGSTRQGGAQGLYYVEIEPPTAAPAPKKVVALPVVRRTVEPTFRVPLMRQPARLIKPPTPVLVESPLLAPHKATPATALRPMDPFSIKVKSQLERAIEEFGDTPEVHALFEEE